MREALHDCGLSWLTRRGKRRIAKPDKKARVAFAKWVAQQPQRDLNKWAYTDGTTFYLAKSKSEKLLRCGLVVVGGMTLNLRQQDDGIVETALGTVGTVVETVVGTVANCIETVRLLCYTF